MILGAMPYGHLVHDFLHKLMHKYWYYFRLHHGPPSFWTQLPTHQDSELFMTTVRENVPLTHRNWSNTWKSNVPTWSRLIPLPNFCEKFGRFNVICDNKVNRQFPKKGKGGHQITRSWETPHHQVYNIGGIRKKMHDHVFHFYNYFIFLFLNFRYEQNSYYHKYISHRIIKTLYQHVHASQQVNGKPPNFVLQFQKHCPISHEGVRRTTYNFR